MLKEHGGYDAAKRRSRDRYIGSLRIHPKVPDRLPDQLQAKLTPGQRAQLEQWLDRFRTQRKTEDAKGRIPAALAANNHLVDSIMAGDITLTEEACGALMADLGTLLGLLQDLMKRSSAAPSETGHD